MFHPSLPTYWLTPSASAPPNSVNGAPIWHDFMTNGIINYSSLQLTSHPTKRPSFVLIDLLIREKWQNAYCYTFWVSDSLVCGGTWESAFRTSSQVLLLLLLQGPLFGKGWCLGACRVASQKGFLELEQAFDNKGAECQTLTSVLQKEATDLSSFSHPVLYTLFLPGQLWG